MEKRVRSPNYPALSLPEAIERLQLVYSSQHKHGAPREVVAKSMGYTGLNGASATAISALIKFGLLERDGEELRVSERAMCIIAPQSADEKSRALRDAALDPPLFAELAEKFPGKMPSDDLLKNYLVRNGFAPGAINSVIAAYKETSELVGREGGGYDSGSSTPEGSLDMHAPTHAPVAATDGPVVGKSNAKTYSYADSERQIGRYDFEEGRFVRIAASADLSTEEALDMAETIIELKRKELKRKKAMATGSVEKTIDTDKDIGE